MQFRVRPSSKKSNNNETSFMEFPTIKSFNQGESSLPRSSSISRVEHLSSALSTFQQLYRKQKEAEYSNNIELQKRIDRIEYKVFSAEQELKQLHQIREIRPSRDYNHQEFDSSSKNQIILLKQALIQERQAHKEGFKHQNTLIQQLTMKQMRAEQEFRELIAQQRMDYQYRLTGQGEQNRQIESVKQRRIQQQYELMKGVISNAQRKIFEELQRKIQNEVIIKDYIQNKLIDLRQEISNDHKETISAQTKFIKQTKESLSNLFALITNVRKQLSEELAETQKLSVRSIQRISKTLDIMRSKSADEIKQMNTSCQQISNQLVQIRQFFTTKLQENRQFMSEFEEQTMQKLQHSGYRGGPIDSDRISLDGQRLSLFQKQMNQWKSITQQKNLNVFKQISNTLKTMKLEWRKQNDELVSEVAALDQALKSVKKQGPNELKKNIQALIAIFNNQFDVLADQLQSLTQMIALAKKENQKSLIQQINKSRFQTLEETKIIITQKIKQGNSYTDKSIAKSQQNLKGIISKQVKSSSDILNLRMQKLQKQISQLQSSLKKNNLLTISQLQDYSVKLKNFNDSYKQYLQESRKEDLKKRNDLEQSMRKNASSLMDICYQKSQFLVQGLKKNIQTSQIKEKLQNQQALQNAKDQLKKEVQVARLQWQKQLSMGVQKLTKQRQNSEQILHQAIQQSLNNTKTNLTNQLNTAKIQLQQKLNDFKVKQVQKQAQNSKEQTQLKTAIQKMIQQEHKVLSQSIHTVKTQVQNQIQQLDKKNTNTTQQIEKNLKYINDELSKKIAAQGNSLKEKQATQQNQNKLKENQLQKKIQSLTIQVQKIKKGEEAQKKIGDLTIQIESNHKKIEELNLKFVELQKSQSQKQKLKQGESKKVGEQSLKEVQSNLQKQIKSLQTRVEQLYAKQENEDPEPAISDIRKSVNKLEAMAFSQQAKNKALFDRLTQDINKISQNVAMITNQLR